MIKIRVIAVGKDKDAWVSDASNHYIKLLKRFADIDIAIVPSVKSSANMPASQIKKNEAERLMKKIAGDSYVALSDSGKKMDSTEFSRWLERTIDSCSGRVSFVIGGAYGLDDSILSQAKQTVSLSALTFSHQLVRPVLLEQLYRGLTIIHNTGYHK